jgi:hypothetical protein
MEDTELRYAVARRNGGEFVPFYRSDEYMNKMEKKNNESMLLWFNVTNYLFSVLHPSSRPLPYHSTISFFNHYFSSFIEFEKIKKVRAYVGFTFFLIIYLRFPLFWTSVFKLLSPEVKAKYLKSVSRDSITHSISRFKEAPSCPMLDVSLNRRAPSVEENAQIRKERHDTKMDSQKLRADHSMHLAPAKKKGKRKKKQMK